MGDTDCSNICLFFENMQISKVSVSMFLYLRQCQLTSFEMAINMNWAQLEINRAKLTIFFVNFKLKSLLKFRGEIRQFRSLVWFNLNLSVWHNPRRLLNSITSMYLKVISTQTGWIFCKVGKEIYLRP